MHLGSQQFGSCSPPWVQLQDAFPELVKASSEAPVDPYAPEPLSVTRIPAAGLLDYWPDEFEMLSPREQANHEQATEWHKRAADC